jgi:hypothetical protein
MTYKFTLSSGSDYSDSLCNVTTLIRELTALTGLEMEDTVSAVDTVKVLPSKVKKVLKTDGSSSSSSGSSSSSSSSSSGDSEIDGVSEEEVVDEEEDESLLAEALLVTDVSPTLTNISDLPGEGQTDRHTHPHIDGDTHGNRWTDNHI